MSRRAILIGNADYTASTDYPDLSCPAQDVAGMAEQLRRKDRGGFAEVMEVVDKSSTDIKTALFAFLNAAEATDTVLVYFSGHGDLDSKLSLYFCAADSRRDMLEVTAVSSSFMWDLLDKCRATRKAVILDCCYSGAASGKVGKGSAGTVLRAEADAHGSFLMTAADSISSALEKEGDRYGLFTKHLIEGIASGEADIEGAGQITLNNLYSYVERRSKQIAAPLPQFNAGGQGRIVIAQSGQDPRKDRAKALRKRLYLQVAEGNLTDATAGLAMKIAAMRPTDMAPWQSEIDKAIDAFMTDSVTLAQFVEDVQTARRKGTARPKRKPNKPREPDPPKNAAGQKEKTGTPTDLNPFLLRYGIPGGALVITPVMAGVTAGNGLLPGLILVGVTGWNLNANGHVLGLGGKVANGIVCGFGVLVFIAGLLG